MAKVLSKLTDRQVKSLPEGRHSDGGGLFLVVGKTTRRWVFMFRLKRVRGSGSGPLREMPVGRYGDEQDGFVGLASARLKAGELRKLVAEGSDPTEAKPVARKIPTFGEMADELVAKKTVEYRSKKSLARLKRALEHHAKPLRDVPVDRISEDDVHDLVGALWGPIGAMAEKVRGYIWTVMENASHHYTGRNPATWIGRLERRLPKRKRLKKGHHPALPYSQIPEFMVQLRTRSRVADRALEFLILTAVRSGEVRVARWSEFDLKNAVWTIPDRQTKSERMFRVPLSGRALAILREIAQEGQAASDFVFPGIKPGQPLSDGTFGRILDLMNEIEGGPVWVDPQRDNAPIVPHGFRSSFRDWAEDKGEFPFALAEQALAHVVGDGTVRAYRRSDALEKRRPMMKAWAEFCERGASRGRAKAA